MPFRPARQVNPEPTKNLPRLLVDIANNPRPIRSETTHSGDSISRSARSGNVRPPADCRTRARKFPKPPCFSEHQRGAAGNRPIGDRQGQAPPAPRREKVAQPARTPLPCHSPTSRAAGRGFNSAIRGATRCDLNLIAAEPRRFQRETSCFEFSSPFRWARRGSRLDEADSSGG